MTKLIINLICLAYLVGCGDVKPTIEIIEKWSDSTAKTVHYYTKPKSDSTFIEKEFYGSGVLRSEFSFKNGLRNGLATGYFEDSVVAQKVLFIKNKKSGLEITNYPSGKLRSNYEFELGKPFAGGQFFENGQIMGDLIFEKGYIIKGKYYYADGTVRVEGGYIKKEKDGFWRFFYENGNIKEQGFYEKNKKTGLWKYYLEDGSFKHEANFSF